MKKLTLPFLLVFGLTNLTCADNLPPLSSDSKVGKWRSFVGVGGGVGAYTHYPTFLIVLHPIFFPHNNDLADLFAPYSPSYGGEILGGWQKYKTEKTGIRNTLGLRIFSAKSHLWGGSSTEVAFYYAFDGLIDFVKRGKNRFGMSLGFGLDILHLTFNSFNPAFAFSWMRFSPRLRFYTQFDRHIIDLTASIPLFGVGAGYVGHNHPLVLG